MMDVDLPGLKCANKETDLRKSFSQVSGLEPTGKGTTQTCAVSEGSSAEHLFFAPRQQLVFSSRQQIPRVSSCDKCAVIT